MWIYWWIPILVVKCYILAWLTKRTNESATWGFYFWCLLIASMFSLWVFVAKMSPPKQLFANAVLYDSINLVLWACFLALVGAGSHFTALQWTGLGIAMGGYALMRVG